LWHKCHAHASRDQADDGLHLDRFLPDSGTTPASRSRRGWRRRGGGDLARENDQRRVGQQPRQVRRRDAPPAAQQAFGRGQHQRFAQDHVVERGARLVRQRRNQQAASMRPCQQVVDWHIGGRLLQRDG
jgi:hypothetical protein